MAEIEANDQAEAQREYVGGNYTENRYWKRAKQYASGALSETLNKWEKEKEKKQEQIKKLTEKLRSGQFEMTEEEQVEQERLNAAARSAFETARTAEDSFAGSPEVQEVTRLEGLIESKKTTLAGLGFFKGKEKKELQAQIDTLEGTLAEAKKQVSAKQPEISELKKQAEDAARLAKEYGCKAVSAKKKPVIEQLCQLRRPDFSGETVWFGRYEQGSGIEPIEWRVLERTDKGILLITQYAIEKKKYHEEKTEITWENCDLRKWLNQDFLKMAFDEVEQMLIADTRCPVDNNLEWYADAGNATTDKVFLLSIPEAEKYFNSDEDRKAVPTAYAKKQGADTSDKYKTVAGEKTCQWWLRSPGPLGNYAAVGSYDGSVYSLIAEEVNSDNFCVRPALWINL